jgi:hypothetical protein
LGNDGRITKAVERAVSFHGTWTRPKRAGRWLIGQTFAVLAEREEGEEVGESSSKEQSQLAKLISTEGQVDASLDKGPHGVAGLKAKCKYRLVRDARGHTQAELGYPLYDLARKVGADSYKTHTVDQGKVVVYGYKEDDLVGIFAARKLQETCVDGEETKEAKDRQEEKARAGRQSAGVRKRAPLN